MSLQFAAEIRERAREIDKAKASDIAPKSETTFGFLHSYVVAGRNMISGFKAEKERVIKENNETYAKKVADEKNAPLIAELKDDIQKIKDLIRTRLNNTIDARINKINSSRKLPLKEESKALIEKIKLMLDSGVVPTEQDWKSWVEVVAGDTDGERIFAALASKNGVDVLPSSDREKTIEDCEAFRQMGNIAIDYIDHPNDNITAMAFFKPGDAFMELMESLDSNPEFIIPAERLTILQRLTEARENAWKKDNVKLYVAIGRFIDDNKEALATPEELKEALYAEAESFVQQGMTAKKEI